MNCMNLLCPLIDGVFCANVQVRRVGGEAADAIWTGTARVGD